MSLQCACEYVGARSSLNFLRQGPSLNLGFITSSGLTVYCVCHPVLQKHTWVFNMDARDLTRGPMQYRDRQFVTQPKHGFHSRIFFSCIYYFRHSLRLGHRSSLSTPQPFFLRQGVMYLRSSLCRSAYLHFLSARIRGMSHHA